MNEGVLKFEYKGKHLEIPYSQPDYGAKCIHLTDKKRCVHIIYFERGKWVPLWHETYSEGFKEALDAALKLAVGNGV